MPSCYCGCDELPQYERGKRNPCAMHRQAHIHPPARQNAGGAKNKRASEPDNESEREHRDALCASERESPGFGRDRTQDEYV